MKIVLLVLSEALFLWMFFAADSLEQLAAAGAFGDSPATREAAFAFAASWRHGMSGHSPLYMPGFFAVAIAAWMWLESATDGVAIRYAAALCAAAIIAAVAAPAGGSVVLTGFENASGLSAAGPVPGAGPAGMFRGLCTLVTWTIFVVGCQLALHWRTLMPLAPVVPLTAALVALRQSTVDEFTTVWWHRAAAGDLIAVTSLIMIPAIAGWLYSRMRPAPSIQLPAC